MVTYCNGFVISSQVVRTEPKSARPAESSRAIVFIIFINELVEILAAHGIRVKLCADDSKMYAETIEGFDVVRCQAALDSLTQWAEHRQL